MAIISFEVVRCKPKGIGGRDGRRVLSSSVRSAIVAAAGLSNNVAIGQNTFL